MKYFCFTDGRDVEMFNLLMRDHKAAVRQMVLDASGEAANAKTDPEGDDMLRDDDMMVFERMKEKLEEYAEQLAYDETGLDEEASFFADLFWTSFRQIDFLVIAKAIFYGVEPDSDPHKITIPEIL